MEDEIISIWAVRNLASKMRLFLSSLVVCICIIIGYKIGLLDYFFPQGIRHQLRAIVILGGVIFAIEYGFYLLYDSWVVYEESIQGIIIKKEKKPIPEMNPQENEQRYHQSMINTNEIYAYSLIVQREDDINEVFKISFIAKEKFDTLKETELVKILKKRTMAETHYYLLAEWPLLFKKVLMKYIRTFFLYWHSGKGVISSLLHMYLFSYPHNITLWCDGIGIKFIYNNLNSRNI